MTNDYYINLADYYTNQLVNTSGLNALVVDISNKTIQFDDYFTNTLGASTYTIGKWLTWDGTNNIVLYGTVVIGGNTKNYILRVPYENNTYNLSNASFYTTYEGGTSLPYFWDLIVDNDGSLYGMVSSSSPDSNGFALIMLGNPFITGGIKFRQSYIIPNTYSSYTNYQRMIKKINTGEYLLIFDDSSANTLILHMTINVGYVNDFVATTVNAFLNIYDYYITWDENIRLNLLCYDSTGETGDYYIRFNVYTYDGSYCYLIDSYSYSIGHRFRCNTAKYYNYNFFYYTISYLSNYNGAGTSYTELYKGYIDYNYANLVSSRSGSYDGTNIDYLESIMAKKQQIEIGNGLVFYKGIQTETPYPNNKDFFGEYEVEDNTDSTITSLLKATLDENYNYFFINNIFNSYKAVIPGSSNTSIVTFEYDPYSYNKTPFKRTNLFIPHRIKSYDSNSTLIFDRNIYNLKVYNNVTEATFNVPNTLLNDTSISESKMFGITCYCLVDDTTSITKNIYENLMINFFNSIVVSDYTGRIYNSGGARVNDSISKTNDMANASVGKIKVFYSNNTTLVYLLPTPTITGYGSPMTIQYNTSIAVASLGNVLKYQILSNDEQTIYFEYDMSSVGAGTYQLIQECIVE